MKRDVQLDNEIEILRKDVNNFIEQNGLKSCQALLELSEKLDKAIVKWVIENDFRSLPD